MYQQISNLFSNKGLLLLMLELQNFKHKFKEKHASHFLIKERVLDSFPGVDSQSGIELSPLFLSGSLITLDIV